MAQWDCGSKPMKLLNINIGIRIANTEQISDLIIEQNADFVSLQEVVRNLDKKVFPQFKSKEGIEKAVRYMYPYSFFGPLWITNKVIKNSEVTRDFGGYVEQGNELLSKYPIESALNEFFYKSYELKYDWTDWEQTDHGRALLITDLKIGSGSLRILNIHGIWTKDKHGDERTIRECEFIIKKALEKEVPTIVVGDLNLLPDTASIKILDNHLKNLVKDYKIKTTRPDFKDHLESGLNIVDYIFVNRMVKVKHFQTINSDVSDHLPLLMEFDL